MSPAPLSAVNGFLGRVVVQIVNPLILLMVAVAFVVFVWGVFEFVRDSADDVRRDEGRRAMLWGLIGLVIMFGAYGIINLALSTFNLPPVHPITH